MATKYGGLLWSLLPPGAVWQYLAGKFATLFDKLGENFQDAEDRARDFLAETRAGSAVETLPEWEASYGLEVEPSATIETRQKLVVAKRTQRPSVTPKDYLELAAPLLGVAPEELQFIEHTSVSQASRLHPRDVYVGYIYRDPSLPGSYDIKRAQAIVDQKTQAHRKIKIIESIAFRVNNTHSRVNRDLVPVPGSDGGRVSTALAYRREDGSFLRREDGSPLGRG